jgi:hypothetical protein
VTAGSALGAGPALADLGIGFEADRAADVEKFRAYMPAFIEMAGRPDATPSFKHFVKTMRAYL